MKVRHCLAVNLSVLALCCASLASAQSAAAGVLRRPVDTVLSPAYSALYDHDAGTGAKNYYCDSRLVYDRHAGTDFRAAAGTPVRAASAGTIYYAVNTCPDVGYYGSACGGGYGNHVRIDHEGTPTDGQGLVTVYGHLKAASVAAFCGTVACGRQIGLSGSSGNSTGPHLHFEVRRDGYPKDDPFQGTCGTRSASLWVNQNGGIPTTACH